MKNVIIVILAFAFNSELQAQSNLAFATKVGQQVQVWLNNIPQNNTVNRYVRLDNLTAGNYIITLQVSLEDGSRLNHQEAITLNNRYEVSYFVLVENKIIQLCLVNEVSLNLEQFTPLLNCLNRPIMTPLDKESIQKQLDKQKFDNLKVSTLKTIIPKMGVMVADIHYFVKQLMLDEQKLALAKFAYEYTCDSNNYFQSYDTFRYTSSIRELERHIQNQLKK